MTWDLGNTFRTVSSISGLSSELKLEWEAQQHADKGFNLCMRLGRTQHASTVSIMAPAHADTRGMALVESEDGFWKSRPPPFRKPPKQPSFRQAPHTWVLIG